MARIAKATRPGDQPTHRFRACSFGAATTAYAVLEVFRISTPRTAPAPAALGRGRLRAPREAAADAPNRRCLTLSHPHEAPQPVLRGHSAGRSRRGQRSSQWRMLLRHLVSAPDMDAPQWRLSRFPSPQDLQGTLVWVINSVALEEHAQSRAWKCVTHQACTWPHVAAALWDSR